MGLYFFKKGIGFKRPITPSNIQYTVIIATIPTAKVPSMASMDNSTSGPVFNTTDTMEQKVATGMKRTSITVIFRNRSLHASNISFNNLECSPIFSNAIPIRTAKKMSCIMLESKNGFTKFAGMIPTIVSLIEILTSETDTVAASPASFAASSGLPGFNNSNTPVAVRIARTVVSR